MAIRDLQDLLILHRYLLEGEREEASAPHYAAYLAKNFGVVVNAPLRLCGDNVRLISEFFCKNVPESFYRNPQDTTFYGKDELLIEQLVSYINIELRGVESDDPETFARLPVFDKILPSYKKGEEKVVRTFFIIDEEQAKKYVQGLFDGYCKYTRPWSDAERGEAEFMFENGYYFGQTIRCKDNIIYFLKKYRSEVFAKMLDYKDVVKMSVSILGESKMLKMDENVVGLLSLALKNASKCPLSKKQSKYFNKLIKKTGVGLPATDNSDSPYAVAKKMVAKGDVCGAAKYLSGQGSLLLRNLFWLLSRVKSEREAEEVLSMLKISNPVIGVQILQTLAGYDEEARCFVFYKNGYKVMHEESEEECGKRRSYVDISVRRRAAEAILDNIRSYYASRPSIGKIYVADSFRNVGVPVNTSVCGSGLDVYPTGSRLPVKGDYIRAFCYWKNVYDMDLSVAFLNSRNGVEPLYWGNYTDGMFGNSALTSGDARGYEGSEYVDFKITELLEKGWKYGVVFVNAFGGKFNEGDVYCGYQDKDDLETEAWAPDNIQMKISVKGDERQFVAFAIDLERRELIVLNTMFGQTSTIVEERDVLAFKKYLAPYLLDAFNMYTLLSMRGELVDDPADADTVFDPDYVGKEGQKVVRPWDTPLLASYIL